MEKPQSMKELLSWWGVDAKFGWWMKRKGFRMVGRRSTRKAFIAFLDKCPNPCSRPRSSR